jgi:hypothetical protein
MRYHLIVLMFLLALVACDQRKIMQEIAPPADQAVATHYIDLLRQQQFDAIESAMDPSLSGPSMRNTLVSMAGLIPAGEPTSITLVGANRLKTTNFESINLTYEYNFSGNWLVANVAIKRHDSSATIFGFHVYPQPSSLEQQNKFTLDGKSAVQYFVLALAVILPLFTLYALVICVRTTFKGRKWPWILFVIFGLGNFAVNWTTGQWALAPMYLQFFSAGAFGSFYGPWTIGISIPVGAIVFLARRKRLEVAPTAPADKSSLPS